MPNPNEARTPFRPKKATGPGTTRAEMEAGSRYPAILVENYETENAKNAGLLQWFQCWKRLDEQWADGNPVERYNTLAVRFPSGGTAGKGSEAYKLAAAFEAVLGAGKTLLPGEAPDSGANDFIGHVFLLEDRPQPKKNPDDPAEKTYYVRVPVDYLGAPGKYTYTGAVRTRQTQGEGGGATAAEAAVPENREAAGVIAGLLSGLSEAAIRKGDAFDVVVANPQLDGISNVLGATLRGLMISGGIIDKLRDAGLGEVDAEGIFRAAVAVPA